jgi:hypothetical protein
MRTEIQSLRAAIAANVHASRAINVEIHAFHGPDRDLARRRKRSLGERTRSLLLALAFLRDVPYGRVESPHTTHRPDLHAVAGAALGPDGDRTAALTAIRAWVAAPVTQAPGAAAAAAEAA